MHVNWNLIEQQPSGEIRAGSRCRDGTSFLNRLQFVDGHPGITAEPPLCANHLADTHLMFSIQIPVENLQVTVLCGKYDFGSFSFVLIHLFDFYFSCVTIQVKGVYRLK